MRNYFLIFLILIVVLLSCDNYDSNNGENVNKTTLSISNLNFNGVIEVTYGGVDFGFLENKTKEVPHGTHFIYITHHVFTNAEFYEFHAGSNMSNHKLTCICPVYRTNSVTCLEGESTIFNITTNTVVTFINGYGYNASIEVTDKIQELSDTVWANYAAYVRNLTNIDIHNKSDYDILSIKLFDVIWGIITSGESGYLMFDTNDFKDTDTGEISFYLHILNERLYCKFSNISIKRNKTNNEFTFNNDTIITAIDYNTTNTLKNIVDTMTIEFSKPQIDFKGLVAAT